MANAKTEQVKLEGELLELQKVADTGGVSLDDLKDEIIAEVLSVSQERDKEYERDVSVLKVDIEGEGETTFKYGPMHSKVLVKSLVDLGSPKITGTIFKWKKMSFSIGFPRYFPVEILK